MRRLLTTTAVLLALTAPLAAQTGPEKVSIEFDAAKLNLIVKAIGAGLVKNEADPLLQYIQTAINTQMAEWQKAHALTVAPPTSTVPPPAALPPKPEESPAPLPPMPKPAPMPK